MEENNLLKISGHQTPIGEFPFLHDLSPSAQPYRVRTTCGYAVRFAHPNSFGLRIRPKPLYESPLFWRFFYYEAFNMEL